jgi:acetyltransferase-like isoleucine patch superfamily enzyme
MEKRYKMDRKKILTDTEPELKELFILLEKLRNKLDLGLLQELKRSLPFSDVLFDRWERASSLGFGEGTSVYDSAHIFGDVKVGKSTWIGPFTILDGSGGLTIGDNCSISASVQLYSHDSVKWAISGGKEKYEYANTKIGNNCYLAPGSIIAKGVSLEEGCIVGANSFVNKSFPAGSKIAGSPARLV